MKVFEVYESEGPGVWQDLQPTLVYRSPAGFAVFTSERVSQDAVFIFDSHKRRAWVYGVGK